MRKDPRVYSGDLGQSLAHRGFPPDFNPLILKIYLLALSVMSFCVEYHFLWRN